MSTIDLSPLDSAASTSAFSMFRGWNEKALPNEKIHIKNEQLLVEDLKEAFRSAVAAIKREDLDAKLPGWDIGFVIGFVSGSLGVLWYNEYIARNSEQYKILSAMKALSSYFEIKGTELLRVEKLYEHFLTADSNLVIEDVGVDKQLFADDESKLNSLIEHTEYNGSVDTILNNIVLQQVTQIMKNGKNMPNVPVKEHLSDRLIKAVLQLNVYNQER